MGQPLDRDRIGNGEHELEGELVEEVHLHQLAARLQEPGRIRGELLVQDDVLVPELDVLGGERLAGGPLDALAQGHGEHLGVARQLVVGGDVGRLGRQVAGDAVELLDADQQVGFAPVAGAVAAHEGVAAVLADLLVGHHHVRVGGQALLDRRQVAGGHHLGQHRRLAERGDGVAGGRGVVGDVVVEADVVPLMVERGALHDRGRHLAAALRLAAGKRQPGHQQRRHQRHCHKQSVQSQVSAPLGCVGLSPANM